MTLKLSFYPKFNDQQSLSDHFYRTLWYLYPFKEKISEIIIPIKYNNLLPGEVPSYLDSDLRNLVGDLNIKFKCFDSEKEFNECLSGSDGVLLWSMDHFYDEKISKNKIIKVDHNKVQYAGSFYLKIQDCFPQMQSGHYLEKSKSVFLRISERCKSDIGYIFGTGPGLSRALERGYDFSDGICIACNSMVKNRELLDKITPPLIAIADPIFHAGPSSYAAEFRKELIRALDRYEADLIVPMRDYHLYLSHLPPRFAERIAAIPFVTNNFPNLDLNRDFHVTSTGNILTLLLLPVAASLFNKIRIFGCDGRSIEDNAYFWGHDKASQFNEHMAEIKRAHPAFFSIDYNDYYITHCKTLSVWLEELDKMNKIVENHTPSYIPALSARNIIGVSPPDQPDPCASIVMPAFNAARFLSEAIQSIQGQSFLDWELLIIDDHSTDETRTIALEHMRRDARIRVLSSDGKGVSAARNKGVSAARGRYVGFLDADDAMSPGALEARVTALESGRVSLVHSRMHFIDESGRELGMGAGAARDLTFRDMYGFHTHCNTIMGRKELISHMKFPEMVSNGEDWWAFARLLRSGVTSHYVEGGSAAYRMHPTSTVKNNMNDHIAALEKVIDWVYADQNESNISSEFRKGLSTPSKPDVIAAQFVRTLVCSVFDAADEVLEGFLEREELKNWLAQQSNSALRQRLKNIAVLHFAKPAHELRYMPRDTVEEIVNSRAFAQLTTSYPRLSREISDFLGLVDGKFRIEYARTAHAHVDETAVVSELLKNRSGRDHVMLDVGAHYGTSAAYFDKLEWTIHCFEPDAYNREKLLAKHGGKQNVTIDIRGVGDVPTPNVPFFRSEESTGISGLSAFRESHEECGKIDLTTIADVIDERGFSCVDFLKIDVEGFDFNVLKGVPWSKIAPDVIECEYEDAKTVPMGHTWRTIADFLCDKGYAVYISEWHPIIRYGIPHDWRRVVPYPQMNVPADSWGNILAFREDPGFAAVQAAFEKRIKSRKPQPNRPSSTVDPVLAPKLAEDGEKAPSTLADFYNRYKGKRCFIVGNGPSLNQHDLSLLEEEYVFGVNGIFYKTDETAFRPTFFVVEDSKVIEENIERIKTYDVPHKFFPSIYKSLHPHEKNVYFFHMDRDFYSQSSSHYGIPRFSDNAEEVIYCGQSVTYINLQLAFFMGFSEVHLIGMDFDYVIPKEHERRGDLIVSTTDDPNHFHKDYFGKGKTWKDPKLDRVAMNYRQAKLSYEAVGRRIYNATVGGKLEIFPRVDYEALLRDPLTGGKRLEQVAPVAIATGEGDISLAGTAAPAEHKAVPSVAVVTAAEEFESSSQDQAGRTRAQIRAAKLAKFKRDPHLFFRDAHYAILRPLRYLFRPTGVGKWQADMAARKRREAGGLLSFLPASRKALIASQTVLNSERARSESALRAEIARLQRDAQTRETALKDELARMRVAFEAGKAQDRDGRQAMETEFGQQFAALDQRLAALCVEVDAKIVARAKELEAVLNAASADFEKRLAAGEQKSIEVESELRREFATRVKELEAALHQKLAGFEEQLAAGAETSTALEYALREELMSRAEKLGAALRKEFANVGIATEQRLDAEVAALRTGEVSLANELRKLNEETDQAIRDEIAAFKASLIQEKRISGATNAAVWRVHDRHLSEADISHIQKEWLRPLELTLSPRQLGYIAHHICLAEERCEGRIATTIQAATLRALALMSLQSEKIELLEIGTLFGIGAGTLYQAGIRAQRQMRLTLIDPLDGYYKQRLNDASTGVPVTRETLVRNLRSLDVAEQDYRIIQHLSSDPEAVKAASDRAYDYVLIDGDHSLEGVAADFELYAPMVKPGGVIVFDDYATTDWPAVQKFVDEHVRPSEDWLWIGGEWRTGILRRKRRALTRNTGAETTLAPAGE